MVSRVRRRNLFLARLAATGLLTGALLLAMALCTVGNGVAYADGVILATVRTNPLFVTVSSAPGTVFVGHRFQIKAKIENLGAEQISEVVATIQLPASGLTLLSSTADQSLGTLRKQRTARWRLQADAPDNYVVLVSVTGLDEAGYLLTEEGSTVVEVREARDHGRGLFRRLVSMLRSNWPLGNYAHAG